MALQAVDGSAAGRHLCSRHSTAGAAGQSDVQQSAGLPGCCHEPRKVARPQGTGMSPPHKCTWSYLMCLMQISLHIGLHCLLFTIGSIRASLDLCCAMQVSVAGALSSIAAYAAKRDYKLHTPDAGQAPPVPKGPWVLDQVLAVPTISHITSTIWQQVACLRT